MPVPDDNWNHSRWSIYRTIAKLLDVLLAWEKGWSGCSGFHECVGCVHCLSGLCWVLLSWVHLLKGSLLLRGLTVERHSLLVQVLSLVCLQIESCLANAECLSPVGFSQL